MIVRQHHHSDGLSFANVGTIQKYQASMKMQSSSRRSAGGWLLVLEVERLVDVVSQGLAWLGPAWAGLGSTSILIRDLWSEASLRNICWLQQNSCSKGEQD